MRNGNRFNGEQWTVAKELQKGGYDTAVIGKWHLLRLLASTTGKFSQDRKLLQSSLYPNGRVP